MANTLTLTQLIAAVRQRSDTETSLFVTDTEITSYINQSYQELYDVLVQKYGDDYFVSPTPFAITTDGTNDHYALPTDFQKLLGVDLAVNAATQTYITLKPFMLAARNRNSRTGYLNVRGIEYKLSGSKLWLKPLPAAGVALRLFYIPKLTELASGSDIADNLGGWLEYVIVDAAIKCVQKEESDVSVLMMQKQALLTRIEAAAENRDAGNPQTVSDSRGDDGYGFGDGSGGGIW